MLPGLEGSARKEASISFLWQRVQYFEAIQGFGRRSEVYKKRVRNASVRYLTGGDST
jgi:hypothetical protein